jgi:polyribonucleotide nucleotidyltransferase
MLTTLRQPRTQISNFAPRLIQIRINPEKIGLLIGPGGKTIKGIQETTGAKIDVDDDGTVYISHMEAAKAEAARQKVEALTEEVRVGKIYEGRVTSVKDFGAFIEILPGRDGLCHISELDDKYVDKVENVCRVGDVMQVKVIAIDDQDRVKLSRKAVLREQNKSAAPGGDGGPRRSGEPAPRRRPEGPGGGNLDGGRLS